MLGNDSRDFATPHPRSPYPGGSLRSRKLAGSGWQREEEYKGLHSASSSSSSSSTPLFPRGCCWRRAKCRARYFVYAPAWLFPSRLPLVRDIFFSFFSIFFFFRPGLRIMFFRFFFSFSKVVVEILFEYQRKRKNSIRRLNKFINLPRVTRKQVLSIGGKNPENNCVVQITQSDLTRRVTIR